MYIAINNLYINPNKIIEYKPYDQYLFLGFSMPCTKKKPAIVSVINAVNHSLIIKEYIPIENIPRQTIDVRILT